MIKKDELNSAGVRIINDRSFLRMLKSRVDNSLIVCGARLKLKTLSSSKLSVPAEKPNW